MWNIVTAWGRQRSQVRQQDVMEKEELPRKEVSNLTWTILCKPKPRSTISPAYPQEMNNRKFSQHPSTSANANEWEKVIAICPPQGGVIIEI